MTDVKEKSDGEECEGAVASGGEMPAPSPTDPPASSPGDGATCSPTDVPASSPNDATTPETAQEHDEMTEETENTGSPSHGDGVVTTLPLHPLQSRWTLWYLKADRNRDWEDCLAQVASFDCVEDFWSLYNHVLLASGLTWGCDYYLFKEGIKPMWEDENNVRGGRWVVQVEKHRRVALLDKYWLELLMAVVGEQFGDYSEHICGAVVNVRQKGDKVSLWTREAAKDDANLSIGHIMKTKLGIPDTDTIRYEVHRDSSVRTGSLVKPRLLIPSK